MGDDGTDLDARSLLIGVDRGTTVRALLLAVTLLLFVVGVEVVSLALPRGGQYVAWGVLRTYAVPAGGVLPQTFGVATVTALAAINAYHNAGYLPSLLLAGAPAYGFWLVFGDEFAWFGGPVVLGRTLAPGWALVNAAPAVVVYGTLGFLLGLVIRRKVLAAGFADGDDTTGDGTQPDR